ncbi:MAG: hypothetical protein ACFFBV_14440 [Promethearchaeota archaeon]
MKSRIHYHPYIIASLRLVEHSVNHDSKSCWVDLREAVGPADA